MNELPTINRYAVILLPAEACLEWVKSCPGNDNDTTLEEKQLEPTVYLIPEGDADPKSYVRRHFKAMFEEELNSWYTDPELWPRDLSFKTFNRFFTIQIATMVFDLGRGRIVSEVE